MPVFKILSRVDAYVDYVASVKAETAEEAVDLANNGFVDVKWKRRGVIEFDARHVVALDDAGNEIEEYSRGKG